jgi:hypothetical protein
MGQTLVGVLSVYANDPGAFSEDHQRIAEMVAKQISPAVQRLAQDRVRNSSTSGSGYPDIQALSNNARTDACVILINAAISSETILPNGLKDLDGALDRCIGQHLRSTDIFFRDKDCQYIVIRTASDKHDTDALVVDLTNAIDMLFAELRFEKTRRVLLTHARTPEDGTSIYDLILVAASRNADVEGRHNSLTAGRAPKSIH